MMDDASHMQGLRRVILFRGGCEEEMCSEGGELRQGIEERKLVANHYAAD